MSQPVLRIHAIDILRSTICPFCRSSLRQANPIVHCIRCRTGHHLDCWNENHGHCSVFSCNSTTGRLSLFRSWIWWTLLFHNLLNLGIHFGIHSLGPLVNHLNVPHAFALLGIESGLIVTGAAAWLSCKMQRIIREESPLSFLSAVTLASNTVFLLFLVSYLLSNGIHALIALIDF